MIEPDEGLVARAGRWLATGTKVEICGKRGQLELDSGAPVGGFGIVEGKVRAAEVETYRVKLLDGRAFEVANDDLTWIDHFPHEKGFTS